jgi:predicted NBD/HSP70 family sugar kinase
VDPVVAAVDIGGTKIAAGLVSAAGHVINELKSTNHNGFIL